MMEELVNIIKEMGIPFAYHHFAEGESPIPPFICYLLPNDDDSLMADGIKYYNISRVRLELYTDFKDQETERLVTDTLESHGIAYSRDEEWIADERLYEEVYEFDMAL